MNEVNIVEIKILKFHCLFLLIICDQASSSLKISYLKNYAVDMYEKNERNMIEEFFMDLKKVLFERYEPHQMIITGASRNDYIERALNPFRKNYPKLICTEIDECEYRKIFGDGHFAVIFLEDLTEETFEKNMNIISRCRKCKVLFFCDGIIENDDVQLIFDLAIKQNLTFSELAHFDGDGIGLYSKFYGKSCTIEARLVDIWRPGTGREKINEWAYKFHHHGGCPVVISSLTFTPKMMIKDYKNGSREIIGGREGKLILEAAQRLNFSVVLTYPSVVDRMRFSLKSAILIDIIFENADIGIGSLLRTNYFSGLTEFSVPYDDECVTWGVPRIMSWSSDVVFVEFSGLVWIAVTLMFLVICLIGTVNRKLSLTKADDKKIDGIISVTCDVFALHLGNPVLWITSSPSGRVLLIVCLFYSTVITTAYKTSLASILATDKGTSAIVDAEGILMENLSVGGSLYEWNILRDQVNESELTAELFKRFVVDNDDVATRDRLKFDHHYAFLSSRSWMSYERQKMVRNHEAVTFDVFDTCVLAYPTVVSFPKKSLLRKPMDRIIQRLTESGIFNHWDLENEIDANSVVANENEQESQNHGAAYKFQNIFAVYLVCITLSLFVFISELLVAKLQSKKGQDIVIQYF